MHLLSRENIAQHYDFITNQDWEKVDFTRFSKAFNPDIKQYDSSFDNLNQ